MNWIILYISGINLNSLIFIELFFVKTLILIIFFFESKSSYRTFNDRTKKQYDKIVLILTECLNFVFEDDDATVDRVVLANNSSKLVSSHLVVKCQNSTKCFKKF